jgi:hypothetical protein
MATLNDGAMMDRMHNVITDLTRVKANKVNRWLTMGKGNYNDGGEKRFIL